MERSEITRHHDDQAPPGRTPWVGDHRPRGDVEVVDPDPGWLRTAETLMNRVRDALGVRVLGLQHVGSTAVPGLPAKPVVDLDLTVADPAAEASYLPELERAGFVLVVREPWWQEHRCLVHEAPRCNLHVFGPGAAEPVRHRIFRDWLLEHAEERDRYAAAKRDAAAAARAAGEHTMQYNHRKQAVVREIYDRAFRAKGLL